MRAFRFADRHQRGTVLDVVCFPPRSLRHAVPVQYLDQGTGCYSQRCFMNLQDLDGTTALTSNTDSGLAVMSESAPSAQSSRRIIRRPIRR